mmetsp:Transcript_530/g.920  ORF Transcript_530/g.920 Transcript_530/m.920 type:complete len:300 (+) Transcript_530:434-1333(+)
MGSRWVGTAVASHLEGMDLDTSLAIKVRIVRLVDTFGNGIELRHQFLEGDLGDEFDESRSCVVANISRRIVRELDHGREIDNLPEKGSLQNQFNIVVGTTIKLKAHVHGPHIKNRNVQITKFTPTTTRPFQCNNLGIGRKKETPLLRIPSKVKHILPILITNNTCLIVRQLGTLPNFQYLLILRGNKELLFRHKMLLTRPLVARQNRSLVVNFNRTLLGTKKLLKRAKKHQLLSTFDPDGSCPPILDFDILKDLQIQRLAFVAVHQTLFGTWHHTSLFTKNDTNLSRSPVHKADIFVCL